MESDTNIVEMTLERLALEYEKADIGLKDLTAAKDILSEEIISRMKNKEEMAGEILLNRCVKKTPDISLETATDMGATKLVIDTKKIAELKKQGIAIPEKEGKPYLLYSRVM